MNKSVMVFLKKERFISALIENGIRSKGVMIQFPPLSAPVMQVIISNVPLFINNEVIMKELARFVKFATSKRMIPLDSETRPVISLTGFHVFKQSR